MTIIRIVRSSGVAAGGPIGDEVTTLRLTSGSSGTWPWTFAQGFAEGDVPVGTFITTNADSTQADTRNRWRDGSAKIVVLSGVSTFVANVTKTISIFTTASTPSGTTVAEPTTLDCSVVLTGDVTGTYTLQSCLGVDRSTWSKSDAGRVRSIPGIVMSEFHYYRPTTDAHISIWFFVRAYATGSVEVETVFENGWMLVTSPASKAYAAAISVNGSSVYSKKIGLTIPGLISNTSSSISFSGDMRNVMPDGGSIFVNDIDTTLYTITSSTYNGSSTTLNISGGTLPTVTSATVWKHFHHQRWSRVDWISGGVAITPQHDVAYMRSTKLVPNYGYTAPSASKLNGLSQTLSPAPFALGEWSSVMGATGTQTPIAILPQQEALYWASGDQRASKAVISNCRGSGRWPIFYRDEGTGRVPLYASYKTRSLTQGWGTPLPTTSGGGPIWDIPHHPSMGYSAYLIEGRWSQMECAQFSAMNCNLETDTGRRGTSGGELQIGSPLTTRGLGWAIRTVGQAAAITPVKLNGSDPAAADLALQTAFKDSIDVTMAYTKARFIDVGGAEYNTIGWIGHYFGDDDEDPGIWGRVWMADFQGMSVCHTHNLAIEGLSATARSNFTAVRDHVNKDIVRRFGDDTTWNFRRAALYNMPYQDASEVFLTTAAALDIYLAAKGLPALTANAGDTLKNHSENTDMGGTSSSNDVDGYWAITLCNLSFAVDAGATGAQDGWDLATAASNYDPSAHGADDAPQFGVVPLNPAVALTALGTAAASLTAGKCLKFDTISQAVIQCGGENAPMTKYGSSGVWDPIRKEVGFIGKRDSVGFPYHWLVYDEATDAWSSSRAVWSGGQANQNGHGYDHNACDPATGTRYHRPYNSSDVQVWNDSWTTTLTPMPSPIPEIAGFLTWFPGIGLIYGDRRTIRRHNGTSGSWTTIQDLGSTGNAYHGVGEYNPNSNVLIWGCGNADDAMKMMDSSQNITNIPTPPFNCGSSELQGLLCADPAGDGFIIWEKATGNWAFWKPGDVAWTTLTQSTGNGSSPQTGLPNLDEGTAGRHSICIPIDDYGVLMFVQAGSTTADVWLYRHS